MPKGTECKPKINMTMAISAISISVGGRKINLSLALPVISNTPPPESVEASSDVRGDVLSVG